MSHPAGTRTQRRRRLLHLFSTCQVSEEAWPHLGDVVLVQASLEADPGLGLEVGDLFDDLEDVGHLLDGNHLLVPEAHPQVADALDGRLHVRLLVRLHVDVALHVVGRHHRLDLKRLQGEREGGGGDQREPTNQSSGSGQVTSYCVSELVGDELSHQSDGRRSLLPDLQTANRKCLVLHPVA